MRFKTERVITQQEKAEISASGNKPEQTIFGLGRLQMV